MNARQINTHNIVQGHADTANVDGAHACRCECTCMAGGPAYPGNRTHALHTSDLLITVFKLISSTYTSSTDPYTDENWSTCIYYIMTALAVHLAPAPRGCVPSKDGKPIQERSEHFLQLLKCLQNDCKSAATSAHQMFVLFATATRSQFMQNLVHFTYDTAQY